MCGVIGYTNPSPTEGDLEQLLTVLMESGIRGLHACGFSYSDGSTLHTYTYPQPITSVATMGLVRSMVSDNGIHMIAHARYSTSDLAYNQPIQAGSTSIVHNGVITQLDPDGWVGRWPGYRCVGRNDSELLLRCILAGGDPMAEFPGASIAALTLAEDGTIRAMRNGLRPLWTGSIGQGTVWASTRDILARAGVRDAIPVLSIDQLHPDLQDR